MGTGNRGQEPKKRVIEGEEVVRMVEFLRTGLNLGALLLVGEELAQLGLVLVVELVDVDIAAGRVGHDVHGGGNRERVVEGGRRETVTRVEPSFSSRMRKMIKVVRAGVVALYRCCSQFRSQSLEIFEGGRTSEELRSVLGGEELRQRAPLLREILCANTVSHTVLQSIAVCLTLYSLAIRLKVSAVVL